MTLRHRVAGPWILLLAPVALAPSVGCVAVGPGCGCGVGCAVGPTCGCEPGCAVEPGCGVDPGCGCEPACGVGGCGSVCGTPGWAHAGETYCGDCGCTPHKSLFNRCVGPCAGGGCGGEPGCAVEPGCGCEPGCAVEPGCGCGATVGGCTCGRCPVVHGVVSGVASGLHAIGAEIGCLLSPLGLARCPGGCAGCGELYWNEWHSDPPACCDPCDHCGNWVGPTTHHAQSAPAPDFAPRRIAQRPGADSTQLR